MPKTNLLDIVDVLETYADLYDMFDDNRLVYEALDKVNEELRAIPYVKAIPIEWIIKWVKNWKPYTNVKSDVFYMLEDWEKENDKDSE